jgi:hypothetical protein
MTWLWSLWLLAMIASFAAFEGFALATDRTTLSRFVVNATRAWPPIPFVFGLIVGGLATHFFWHWCP